MGDYLDGEIAAERCYKSLDHHRLFQGNLLRLRALFNEQKHISFVLEKQA
jgi:hypothetical protein